MSRLATTLTGAILLCAAASYGQLPERISIPMDAPPILYTTSPLHDPVAELNLKLANGSTRLTFDSIFGYLPSVLDALRIPRESQLLVFSKTSLQSILISPDNPRALYFNDSTAVAWVRGGPILELAVQDPQQGVIFYTLDQSVQSKPVLTRENVCLGCHQTSSSLDVPGMVVRTVFPGSTGQQVTGLVGSEVDHRTPFEDRWGGWYVTGKQSPLRHLGNAVVRDVHDAGAAPAPASTSSLQAPNREPLQEQFRTNGFPTPYSDVVSLAVFEHQMHMMNLLTRIGWETRAALYADPAGNTDETKARLRSAAKEVVDYMLFVDEAPMTAKIEGTSGFAQKFAAQGPFASGGRSLRQFDFERRLMRYPCSYMIYSDAFKALNANAKDAIFHRIWDVLSGQEKEQKYARLSLDDRRAVVEILHDTVSGLPDYFKSIQN